MRALVIACVAVSAVACGGGSGGGSSGVSATTVAAVQALGRDLGKQDCSAINADVTTIIKSSPLTSSWQSFDKDADEVVRTCGTPANVAATAKVEADIPKLDPQPK